MNFARMTKTVERLVINNSPVILTAVGVVGTVATAYFTGKASFKSAKMIQEEEMALWTPSAQPTLESKVKAKLVWKEFVPPVAVGAVTITAIIYSNRISAKRAAALAAALTVSEKAYSEYREKVLEKLGVNKEQGIVDSIAEDRMANDPVSSKVVIITDGGEVLCYDKMSGRYFKSSKEVIDRSVNEINAQILRTGEASLSDFYERIGLDYIGFSDQVGWGPDDQLHVRFSTKSADDGRPCIVIDYGVSQKSKFSHSID